MNTDNSKQITAYVATLCLTRGIEKVKGYVDENGMLEYGNCSHSKNGEWFMTMPEAIEKANEIKQAEIESLKQQISKIESKFF